MVVVFIWVLVGSLGCALGSLGSFRFAWVHSCAHMGRWVQSGSRGFTPVLLGLV